MALLALLFACANARSEPPMEKDMDCTVKLAAGEDIGPHLVEGAVICLGPGEHRGGLALTTSVTLVGEPGAVLDGGGQRPVIAVRSHQLDITLRGLTLRNGYAETGSGVLLDGWSKVLVEDCVVDGNLEGQGAGRGATARQGQLTVRGTRFGPADDVVITNIAKAELVGCALEGGLSVLDGATVAMTGGSVGKTITVRGTTSRTPTVALAGVEHGPIDNHPVLGGTITESR